MGPSRGTCTDVEVRQLKRGELAQWNDTARCRRGRADGRGVVMICDEPLARRWWGSGEGRRGLVWCTSVVLAGISRCAGLLLVGWRAAEVVTELSQAGRNMVGRRGIR